MILFRVALWVDPENINCFGEWENVISFSFRSSSISLEIDMGGYIVHDTIPIDREILDLTVKPMIDPLACN